MEARFSVLFPMLVKQKLKESGAGLKQIQEATNACSTKEQQTMLSRSLSTHDRLKMIFALAKSEVRTINTTNYLDALNERVSSVCEQPVSNTEFLQDADLFVCLLLVAVSVHFRTPQLSSQLFSNLMIRTQAYLAQKDSQKAEEETEDAVEIEAEAEVTLRDGDTLLLNHLTLTSFVLEKGVFKSDLIGKGADGSCSVAIIKEAIVNLSEFVESTETRPFVQLTEFAPKSLWFEMMDSIIDFTNSKNIQNQEVNAALQQLLEVTFTVISMYKRNSRYYLVEVGNPFLVRQKGAKKNNEEAAPEEKLHSVRRMSTLFTEILDSMVNFACTFLRTMQLERSNNVSAKLFSLLFDKEMVEVNELKKDEPAQFHNNHIGGFTLTEKLAILVQLNFVFINHSEITSQSSYWQLIREGLYDADPACRKLSQTVLKMNVRDLVKDSEKQFGIEKQLFEHLWTTFFDVYDTLESFGSHLTKALWHRVEEFYSFIKNNDQLYAKADAENFKIEYLADFRSWMLVLYQRVGTHSNLKIRRQVLKRTLPRKYITEHMAPYLLKEFLSQINKGLIFKDINTFVQFSKNAGLVYEFYARYFKNESRDLKKDLKILFSGFVQYVSHPQLVLVVLKVLSTDFRRPNEPTPCFIGTSELQDLLHIMNSALQEVAFGNRYLISKYALKMISLYLNQNNQNEPLEYSTLMQAFNKMPMEFFSQRTVSADLEGRKSSQDFVNSVTKDYLQQTLAEYLNNLFTVKAMTQSMPKFSGDSNAILNGMNKMVLALDLGDSQDCVNWLKSCMPPILAAIDGALTSTYMANRLVEQKIHCFSRLVCSLYTYGSDLLRQFIRDVCIVPRLGSITDRIEQNLFAPLCRQEILLSEQDKLDAIFEEREAYIELLKLSIRTIHLHQNQNHNALETIIKYVLTSALKVTSVNREKSQENWSNYLLQYSALSVLSGITDSYAKGIKEAIRAGQSTFFVPEDLFSVGKPILQNLISFRPQYKPNGEEPITQSMHNFFTDKDLNQSKVSQKILLWSFKALADLTLILQFDSGLKAELENVFNSQIVDRAMDLLDAGASAWNDSLFSVLKICYLPVFINQLTNLQDEQQLTEAITKFQQIARRCWEIIQEVEHDLNVEELQNFLDFVFDPELLEIYQARITGAIDVGQQIVDFHADLANEMYDHSQRFWLLLRGMFNHLMFTFATRPHLMNTFEGFVAKFGTCREIRALDSQVKLHSIQTMIPEVVPKQYEKLPLEDIALQGGYIRTMTLILVEGIVKNVIQALRLREQQQLAVGAQQQIPYDPKLLQSIWNIEKLMIILFKVNDDKVYKKQGHIPYTENHRVAIRTWQFLLTICELLDPVIYTPQLRAASPNGDIIAITKDAMWKCLKLNHLTSVRQYIELFLIRFVMRFPDIVLTDPKFYSTLLDVNMKAQVASSCLMMAGYILISPMNSQDAVVHKRKIFEAFIGMCTANNAHCRCIAHYFVFKVQNDSQFGKAFFPSGVMPMLDHLNNSSSVKTMMCKYEIVFNQFEKVCFANSGLEATLGVPLDEWGEYSTAPFVQMLKEVTTEHMQAYRNSDAAPIERKDWWKLEFERRQNEDDFKLHINEECSSNYQRKILTWEQIEFDQAKQKKEIKLRKRNEIIMVASLIDKIPNLAGLARSCEIMNASALVIDNASVVSTTEFKGISVTSEKWLPIYEVKEMDLLKYLAYQKSNGFSILGLEQTANSKMLHEFEFPTKSIMLLGKEKDGIPQEYYSILDYCIEIPQFGVIRSLNVHVSGALCLWEYTKQQIPKSWANKQLNAANVEAQMPPASLK